MPEKNSIHLIILIIAICSCFSCGESKQKRAAKQNLKIDSFTKQKAPKYVYYLNDSIFSTDTINYPSNYFNSVKVECEAKFGRSNYTILQAEVKQDVIFSIKVTNLGSIPIPTIQGTRSISKLKIIINNDSTAMFMTLANFATGIDKAGNLIIDVMAKDSSDIFEIEMPFAKEDLKRYKNRLTWQWEYMEVKSPIIEVDFIKMSIGEVQKHRILVDNSNN